MGFVLDTNIIIDIERGNKTVIDELIKLRKSKSGELHVTFINYAEVYFGLLKSKKQNIQETLSNIDSYSIINTNKEIISLFVELKNYLSQKGTIIPDTDLWIAASCMKNDFVLITKDKDFKKIKNLKTILL